MTDAVEYNDIFHIVRGTLNDGRFKLHNQGVVFKSAKTGKVDQIPSGEIESIHWLRVARGYGIKIILKNGSQFKFDGFREVDFDKVSEFVSKHFNVKLEEKELSVKGWNWGIPKFNGASLSFEVDKKTAFELPLKDVSQATTGKNEVTIEFHQHDSAEVSLMEMRFFVPNTMEGIDPVKEFHEKIMSKADVIQATGDAIVTFSEVACLTPRGRYSIKVFPTFLQLHGKTYDYKIPHTTVLRLFLLPHNDQRFMFFVVSMDPPIRQGQTRYPFLILQFEREQEVSVNLNLTTEEIEDKYKGKLKEKMTGPIFEIMSRILKEIVGRKITVPGNFKGHSGASAINCSHRAGAGLLYPLERGFIFLHKPPIHVRFDELSFVNFARGSTTGRTFDFELEQKNGNSVTFSNIQREDYAPLFDFVTAKKLRIGNKGGKTAGPSVMDDLMDSEDEDHDVYLQHVKAEAAAKDDDGGDDDDTDDSDFDPETFKAKKTSDSSEVSDTATDESGSDGGSDASEDEKPKKSTKSAASKRPSVSKSQGKEVSKSKKSKKDPLMPKRGLSAYFIWLNEARVKIKEENPGIAITEISKKAGEQWRTITDKSKWEALAAKDKERYQKEMAVYKSKETSTVESPKKSKKSSHPKSTKDKKSKTPATKSTPDKKAKSKEFIDSSGDSSSEEDTKRKPTQKPKSTRSKSGGTSEVVSLDDDDDSFDEPDAEMTGSDDDDDKKSNTSDSD